MPELQNFLVSGEDFYGVTRSAIRRIYDDCVLFDSREHFGGIISSRASSDIYKAESDFFSAARVSRESYDFFLNIISKRSPEHTFVLLSSDAGPVLVCTSMHSACGICPAFIIHVKSDSVSRVLSSELIKGFEIAIAPELLTKQGRMRASDEETYNILDELVFYLRGCFGRSVVSSLVSGGEVICAEVVRRTRVMANFVGCFVEIGEIFDMSAASQYDIDILTGLLFCTVMFVRRVTDTHSAELRITQGGEDSDLISEFSSSVLNAFGKKSRRFDAAACPELRKCAEIASRAGAIYEFLCDESGECLIKLTASRRAEECEREVWGLKAGDGEGETAELRIVIKLRT